MLGCASIEKDWYRLELHEAVTKGDSELLKQAGAMANGAQIPTFLSKYYSPMFEDMVFVANSTGNNAEQFVYESKDKSLTLSIEYIKGDRPSTKAVLNNISLYLNNELQSKEGEFKIVTEKEVYAEIHKNQFEKFIYVYDTPGAVYVWTYTTNQNKINNIENKINLIKSLANRQRYETALEEGNVSMGHWGPEIYNYASQLFETGKVEEGLTVLKNLLATSPFNYRAHIDLIEKTKNKEDANNSARIVLKNAEDKKLIDKAAAYLGVNTQPLESIPILDKKETGLQLILIPLTPCNPWVLKESAKIYEKITGVPVKIRLLREKWTLGEPDRIFQERAAQNFLVKSKKTNINFATWNKQKYIAELLKAAKSEDALSEYYIKEFVKKIESNTGQYLIDSYLDWFSRILEKYRSDDDRTMYVGITGINIYSGDNNYIFSLHTARKESQASILSYYMMLEESLSEEYESRMRLTERIAKELVPASLKSLKIPRSTDPTCPYSYSSGVSRLDQKTLILSEPVRWDGQ
jgi:predicted Zn-dependent protease